MPDDPAVGAATILPIAQFISLVENAMAIARIIKLPDIGSRSPSSMLALFAAIAKPSIILNLLSVDFSRLAMADDSMTLSVSLRYSLISASVFLPFAVAISSSMMRSAIVLFCSSHTSIISFSVFSIF